MTLKLSQDLSDALQIEPSGRLAVVDPSTNRLYFVVDAATLEVLERQDSCRAIQAGLESMQSGGGQPLGEAMADLRKEFETPDAK